MPSFSSIAFAVFAAAAPLGVQGACSTTVAADWMTVSDPLAAPVRPSQCASVEQSPPDFAWPDRSATAEYVVTLTYPNGSSRAKSVSRNWVLWDEVLPAGSYSWTVKVTDSAGTSTSQKRAFSVASNAVPFLVPSWSTMYDRARGRSHPRSIPDGATVAKMATQRAAAITSLRSLVDAQLEATVTPAPAGSASESVAMSAATAEIKALTNASMAYNYTKNPVYLTEARQRARNLASWDPYGSTRHENAVQANRNITWTLALVYDWLEPVLPSGEKTEILNAIRARANQIYADIIGSRARVTIRPYDSHGNQDLVKLAAIGVLTAGDLPEAQTYMRDALPPALAWVSPWGGEDGGFGNGSSYATWDTGDTLMTWNVIRLGTSVDLSKRAWVRNYSKMLAYFLPPGTPAGVFGDGTDRNLTESYARYGKAYTYFSPSPLGRWYAAALKGEDPTRVEYLMAPPADFSGAPALPSGTSQAAYLPSVGWAASHSSLADPARISVYFKSSPYGSYNHAHASQNSFVVNAGGKRLAIESGYYDGYKTSHWTNWYKQTRAHNAITYDGGKGQVINDRGASGKVTQFSAQSSHVVVTGDATKAYGGALTKARRSLIHLRPDQIVVYDDLASSTPRQWEWNIHSLTAMAIESASKATINEGGQKLCVQVLAGPSRRFVQTDKWSADASGANMPRQWHGQIQSTQLLAAAEFVVLLNVGCKTVTASASKGTGGWTVRVGTQTVTIGSSVSVASN